MIDEYEIFSVRKCLELIKNNADYPLCKESRTEMNKKNMLKICEIYIDSKLADSSDLSKTNVTNRRLSIGTIKKFEKVHDIKISPKYLVNIRKRKLIDEDSNDEVSVAKKYKIEIFSSFK